MAPNPRVTAAFRAMRALGISEAKVKPVLKKLLKLYEKNWELIEEENYRALADAIFEEEDDTQEEKKQVKGVNEDDMEEEMLRSEPERPFKRLRRGSEVNQPGNVTESPESRAAGSSISPQHALKNKGKQPMVSEPFVMQDRLAPLSPPVSVPGKRLVSERALPGICLKEPMAETGSVLRPAQKVPNTYQLIRPKDEPFVDDMFMGDLPRYGAPIAVLHPDPLTIKDIPVENDESGIEIGKESYSQGLNGERRFDGVVSSSGEVETNGKLAIIQEESSSNLDVATSPLGEVKLSLSCNSAAGRPNFRMPNIDAVIKLTEEKCLHSYKIIDPNFSVMKLLTHVCESFLELGSDSIDESQDGTIYISPTLDVLKRSTARDALGACKENMCVPAHTSNGLVNNEIHTAAVAPQIPRLPPSLNSLDDQLQASKTPMNGHAGKDKDRDLKDPNSTGTHGLVVVPQREVDPDDLRSLHYVNDLTKGEERVRIAWVNEINGEYPSSFHYISQSLVFQNAEITVSLARIGDLSCCPTCFGDCLSSSVPCACARESGREFAYTPTGIVKELFLEECISMTRDPRQHGRFFCQECPLERSKNDDCLEPCKGHLKRKFIKECWSKCGCSKQCGNRVVQRGITCNLQVFLTSDGKGWGLRTLEDLPKGTFVCEYVGEILTCRELYKRSMQHMKNIQDSYLAVLDADWDSKRALKNEKALCLDASRYGNVARCSDANLIEIPVELEIPDHHYYHLAFFTTRKVHALEELTWDYGIDFDEHDHFIKPFQCQCGSKFCRNMKRPNRSKSTSIAR
ncbi:Histone-lysine N-methyltransferase SUVR4/SUVR1/SUVR [Trema orientale]|uniref:Histone-lysine N-methyltransferase SUVR4/SUVR1/SUVR n=1 Tax=Trema orientale TaxID=63057 RepID=A0A2P5D0K2_TREOI|nr:Histone-lysine N-methyltransferase SUVR4/SUVR1/SUVR [Trema orientale]